MEMLSVEIIRGKVARKEIKVKGRRYEYYYIQIPSDVAKRLNLKEGDIVGINIMKIIE